MHCYVIDPNFITQNKLEKQLNEIEQKLHSLGIHGPFLKVRQFDSLTLSIAQQRKNGAHTCVAIGNDDLFLKTINAVQEDKSMTLGYIPLIDEYVIAAKFKIPKGSDACQTIANRHIVDHSLGIMNNYYKFLDFIAIEGTEMSFTCDYEYTVKTEKKAIVSISKNQKFTLNIQEPKKWFTKNQEQKSHFSCKEIIFHSKPGNFELVHPPYIDIKTPIKIQTLSYPHQIIMGKQYTT